MRQFSRHTSLLRRPWYVFALWLIVLLLVCSYADGIAATGRSGDHAAISPSLDHVALGLGVETERIGVNSPLASAVAAPTGDRLQLLVPLYSYPRWWDPTQYVWTQVAAAAQKVPVTVIINPNTGPDGGPPNQDYVRGLQDLRAGGVTILGYVSTRFAARDLIAAKTDIKLYNDYFDVDGVFLDEAANTPGHIAYYQDLYKYAKSFAKLKTVLLNPGTHTVESYFRTPASDGAVIFENQASLWPDYAPAPYLKNYNVSLFAMLAYQVPTVETMKAYVDLALTRHFGYVYVTDGAMPNPWDTLPDYWEEEVDYIAQQVVKITGSQRSSNGVPPAVMYDGKVNKPFYSSYQDWQQVQIEFNGTVPLSAVNRYMSRPVGTSGVRNQQGEAFSYSLDGVHWTDFTGDNTAGWESYANDSANRELWERVPYGWPAWLTLKEPVRARFVRFRWDSDYDAVNEIGIRFGLGPELVASLPGT
jgi:hypothetical protein